MIAYQVPAVMRHLTPLQIIDEGVSSFTAVGLFAFLASVGTPVDRLMLESLINDVSAEEVQKALEDLEELQLIEQAKSTTNIDGMLAELSGEVKHG